VAVCVGASSCHLSLPAQHRKPNAGKPQSSAKTLEQDAGCTDNLLLKALQCHHVISRPTNIPGSTPSPNIIIVCVCQLPDPFRGPCARDWLVRHSKLSCAVRVCLLCCSSCFCDSAEPVDNSRQIASFFSCYTCKYVRSRHMSSCFFVIGTFRYGRHCQFPPLSLSTAMAGPTSAYTAQLYRRVTIVLSVREA
jgi:hypothetical protein